MKRFWNWESHQLKYKVTKRGIRIGLVFMWSLIVFALLILAGQELNRLMVMVNGGRMPVYLNHTFASVIPDDYHFVVKDSSQVKLSALADRYGYDARRLQMLPRPLQGAVSYSFFNGRNLRHEVGIASLGDYITWCARILLFIGSCGLLILSVYWWRFSRRENTDE